MLTSILLATTILAGAASDKVPEQESTISEVGHAITGLFSSHKKKAEQREKAAIPQASAANGSGSISFADETYWIDLTFDGEPVYRRETGAGYMQLNFTSPINLKVPGIPEKARKAIKSIKVAGGGLKLRVGYDHNYMVHLSDKVDKITIEVKLKPGAKAPDPVDDKKTAEEKKKASAKKAEQDKKEAEKKKAAAKKAEEAKKLKQNAPKSEDETKSDDLKKAVAAKQAEEEKKAAADKKGAEANKLTEVKKVEPAPAVGSKADEEADDKLDLPAAAPVAAPAIIKDAKVSFSKNANLEKLRFDFPKTPAAAVFERFGYVWVVFDAIANPAMPKLDGSAVFTKVEKIKSDTMAYKLTMKKDAAITAHLEGNSWIIEANAPADAVPVKSIRANAVAESWVMNAKNVKKSFKFTDDYTDDPLVVFPVTENAGSKTDQVNGDFILGASAIGIVVRPISEIGGAAVIFEGDDIKIKKSASAELAKPSKASDNLQPIYPFKKWEQLSGNAYRDAEKAAAAVGKTELGNFLFSQQMYSEANARLKEFDYATPNFVRAAGNYLTGHYNEAALGFDTVKLEPGFDNNELLMWKIAANEMLSRHNPAGVAMPDTTNFTLPKNLKNYPDKIAIKILLPVAEFFVRTGNYKMADVLLAAMPKGADDEAKSYASYLEGRIYYNDGKKPKAHELWNKIVADDTGRESRAKAGYEAIMADLESQKIKPAEATVKLDRLLIVWRGDSFEYNLLDKLGGLYAGEKNYLKALRVYKAAITKFPGFPDNDRISNEMKTLFAAALANDTPDRQQAFANLTVYYEFKELLPVGDEGDKMTLDLVDKLARFDLFDEAAKMLETSLPAVKDPKKRAEYTTRTAILRFMNHQPQIALDTLKGSDSPTIPSYLKEERVIVATRSLIEIGDLDAALIAAAGLEEGEKNRIRAEVYWKKSDWAQLVEAYKNIEDKTEDDVMKLAIANSVLGNKTNLKLMRGQYADMMAKSSYKSAFDFVTNTDNIDYRDVAGSLKLDETANLIKQFREKIKIEGLKGVDSVKPAEPAPAKAVPAAAPTKTDAKAAAPAAAKPVK